jgi:pimeloyl-ACP methyl ester carboxylesterase
MLPNSDGGAPIQDNEDFIRMMLHKNGITEHVESPHKLKVREITVTAESAGVMFAALWLKSYPESIAGAYFRSPLVGNYARQLGKFMDQDIDPKDIIYDFQVILTCLERLGGETPPGKSRPPPEFMYVALCISTLGVFQYFWNESFSIDLLDSTVLPPGCKPVVCLIHGDRDEFVNVGSSKEMHETLERAGFKSSLTIFPELRHNFDLRKSLEDPDMQPVRNFFVSVYGNSVEESNQA